MADGAPTTATTAAPWIAAREVVRQQMFLPTLDHFAYGKVFYLISALFCLSILLYIATCLRKLSQGREHLWLFKKDSEGYLKPNVYLTVPAFAFIYACRTFSFPYVQRTRSTDDDGLDAQSRWRHSLSFSENSEARSATP